MSEVDGTTPGGATLEVVVDGAPTDEPLTLHLFSVDRVRRYLARPALPPKHRMEFEQLASGKAAREFELLQMLATFGGDRKHARSVDAMDGRFRLDDVPPGEYVLGVARRVDGVKFWCATGRTVVSTAGTVAHRLEWQPRPLPARQRHRIELRLADGWAPTVLSAEVPVELHPERLAPELWAAESPRWERLALAPTGKPGVMQVDSGALWPGRYWLVLRNGLGSLPIDIHADVDATKPLPLEVPPPADVELTLRIRGQSRAFDCATIEWKPRDEMLQLRHWPPADRARLVRVDPVSGRFRFRAPAGGLEVCVRPPAADEHDGLRALEPQFTRTFDAAPGRNELDLEFTPTLRLVLQLRDGLLDVPWPPDATVDLEPLEPAGPAMRSHQAEITVPHPGRYRFRVTGFAGFAAPAAQDVTIGRRRIERVVVPLQRISPE